MSCLGFPVSQLSGSDQGAGSIDIESARAELLRLRAERAEQRERLDDPSENVLADISGSVTVEAVYRVSADGSRDMDAWLWLDAEVGDDRKDPVTAGISGRLNWDLNGHETRGGIIPADDSAFEDYGAIEDDRLNEFLYTAYADFNRVGPLEKLRVGRQYHDGLTGGHFDGVQAFAEPGEDTSLRVYGGVPVDYYKLTGDSPYSSDRIYGASLVNRGWLEDLKFSMEVQGIRDRTDLFGTHNDYRAVLGLTYHFQENLRAALVENVISGQQRDLNGTLDYWDTENTLHFTFNYVWMPETIDDLAYHYTPYTEMMGPLEAYQLFRVMASKGLGDHFEVGADFMIRELTDETDEDLFNPEYTRTQASVTMVDLPVEDLSTTLHYEYWNTTDDDQFSLGGDVRQRLGRSHVLEAGSYFSKFKYRQVTLVDTENVQTYFVRWRWAFARNLTFNVKGEVEDAENDTYNTVGVAVSYRF